MIGAANFDRWLASDSLEYSGIVAFVGLLHLSYCDWHFIQTDFFASCSQLQQKFGTAQKQIILETRILI